MAKIWQLRTKTLVLNRTYVMGILNVTPDSFSDGGDFVSPEKALERALEIEREGADILDIGAQSTKPGCTKISADEELSRLLPVLDVLRGKISIPISIDTFYPEVAKKALDFGIEIINDVTGFTDEKMLEVAAASGCGCVLVHNGKLTELTPFFKGQVKAAENLGIPREKICVDPGIGFSKSFRENLFILKNLKTFALDECAVLIGASRKRVIGECCGNPAFKDRLAGTIAAHTIAIAGGANVIRAHDVKEAVQAAKVVDAILNLS